MSRVSHLTWAVVLAATAIIAAKWIFIPIATLPAGNPHFFEAIVLIPILALLELVLVVVAVKHVIAAARGVTVKRCPQCAELVRKEVRVCRYCGYAFSAATASP